MEGQGKHASAVETALVLSDKNVPGGQMMHWSILMDSVREIARGGQAVHEALPVVFL